MLLNNAPQINRIIFFSLILIFIFSIPKSALSLPTQQCLTKDISNYQWRVRHFAAIPAQLEVRPGESIERCIKLIGVGNFPLVLTNKRLDISINGGPFQRNKDVTIKEGDTLRVKLQAPKKFNTTNIIRLTFNETDKNRRRKVYRIIWQIQTTNTPRPPKTWNIGPSYQYRQVSEILPKLAAGDTILLEPGAEYKSFGVKYISGTKEKPIHLSGNTDSAEKRPIILGGTDKFKWGISLKGSHNWEISNIIIQDAGLGFRNESDNTVLRDVLIRRCRTGILGTDINSGSLSLFNVEVYESGGKIANRPWGHGIYVASDQHSFPGSTFTLKNSYIHDNKGNTIKSRFQNTVIENNWIESGHDEQAKYLLELIGYDGHYDFLKQTRLIKNNILTLKKPGLGTRVGGDGKGGTRGSATFESNIFLIYNNFHRTLVRIFQSLENLEFKNNTLIYQHKSAPLTLVTDELEDKAWVKGHPIISITHNKFPVGTTPLKREHKSTTVSDKQSQITIQSNVLKEFWTTDQKLNNARPISKKYIRNIDYNKFLKTNSSDL